MDKDKFNSFVKKRNDRFTEIYKELFDNRKSDSPIEISLLQISAFSKANDEMLFEVFNENQD